MQEAQGIRSALYPHPLPYCEVHGPTTIRVWGKSWSLTYCPECAPSEEMRGEVSKRLETDSGFHETWVDDRGG